MAFQHPQRRAVVLTVAAVGQAEAAPRVVCDDSGGGRRGHRLLWPGKRGRALPLVIGQELRRLPGEGAAA